MFVTKALCVLTLFKVKFGGQGKTCGGKDWSTELCLSLFECKKEGMSCQVKTWMRLNTGLMPKSVRGLSNLEGCTKDTCGFINQVRQ
jgi:hypothetical protein